MLEKANREEVKFTAPQMLELQNKRITWTWTSMTTITSTQTFIREIKDSVRHLAAVFTLKTWYKSPGYISVFHFGPSCRCVIAQSHWQQSSLSQRCSATSFSSSRGTQRPQASRESSVREITCSITADAASTIRSFLGERRGLSFGGADSDPCWSTLNQKDHLWTSSVT